MTQENVKAVLKIKDEEYAGRASQAIDNFISDLNTRRASELDAAFRNGMRIGREGERKRAYRKRQLARREQYWVCSGVAFASFVLGAWLGVALTNGTW